MEKNKLITFLLILLMPVFDILGQNNRYMVFFTDKQNSEFSVNTPADFLSQKSIVRRQKNQVEIEESDLPVNEAYINLVRDLGIDVFHSTKWLNAILVETTSDKLTMIEDLTVVDRVELVAPGAKLTSRLGGSAKFEKRVAVTNGNDKQDEDITDAQNRMLGVTFMHDLGFEGQNVTVAVFDGGFLAADTQPYLEHIFNDNRIIATYDFVNNIEDVYTLDNHGTRAFSCIGAFLPDQIIGTAPKANFILCISEEVETEFRVEEYNWIFAAEFADSIGVDVISTSLGYNTFDDPTMNYTLTDMDGQTTVISRGAQMAADKGILLVNSAGNLGNDASWQIITAPGDVDDMITVGAIQADSIKSSFSSIGPAADGRVKPDVVALGTNTIVGFDETANSAVFSSGTSFSAPLVAGLAAGLIQAFPDDTKDEIIQKLRDSGHQADNTDDQLGYGIPSFIRATDFVVGIDDDIKAQISLFPNPVNTKINIKLSKDIKHSFSGYTIYSLAGKSIKSGNLKPDSNTGMQSIDVFTLPDGIYFIKLAGKNNQLNYKFFKQ